MCAVTGTRVPTPARGFVVLRSKSAVAEEINRNVVRIKEISADAALNADQASDAGQEPARRASVLNVLLDVFKV
ncbi:MAG: hypothetical protein WCC36_18090 [Gammaproteobacteria bacterium]